MIKPPFPLATALLLLLMLSLACGLQPAEPTSDIEATVNAAVAAAMPASTVAPENTLARTNSAAPAAPPTPDIPATVAVGIWPPPQRRSRLPPRRRALPQPRGRRRRGISGCAKNATSTVAPTPPTSLDTKTPGPPRLTTQNSTAKVLRRRHVLLPPLGPRRPLYSPPPRAPHQHRVAHRHPSAHAAADLSTTIPVPRHQANYRSANRPSANPRRQRIRLLLQYEQASRRRTMLGHHNKPPR